jgi:cell division protein FtsW
MAERSINECGRKRMRNGFPQPSTHRKQSEIVIIWIFSIVAAGLAALYSASSFIGYRDFNDPNFYVQKQFFMILIGATALYISSKISLKSLQEVAPFLYLGSLLLLIAVFIPGLGKKAGGAARWIDLGLFSLQPSDLARVILLIMLSRMYAEETEYGVKKVILTIIIISLPVVLIGIEPDLGTALHLLISASALLFITKFPVRFFFIAALVSIPILYIGVINVAFRLERIKAFLDPWTYRFEGAYQLVASLKAFLYGGIAGNGIGSGLKRFNLQARHTDFILATIAEDTGLIGIIICVLAYFGLTIFCMILLRTVRNDFARTLGMGLILSFFFQFSLNAAVTMGMIPTTGINMPLFSYGGTSMISHLLSFGLIVSAIRESNKP